MLAPQISKTNSFVADIKKLRLSLLALLAAGQAWPIWYLVKARSAEKLYFLVFFFTFLLVFFTKCQFLWKKKWCVKGLGKRPHFLIPIIHVKSTSTKKVGNNDERKIEAKIVSIKS